VKPTFARLGGLRPAEGGLRHAVATLQRGEGGVYLKISEPISLTGSAGGRAKTEPPFRPPRLEAEAKRTILSFSRASSPQVKF